MNFVVIVLEKPIMRVISTSYIILALDGFRCIHGKGLAVLSGKGNREVCNDCPDNYNPEELTWALITLAVVTLLFLCICFCRFYPKIRALFSSTPYQPNIKPYHCGYISRGSCAGGKAVAIHHLPPTVVPSPPTNMNQMHFSGHFPSNAGQNSPPYPHSPYDSNHDRAMFTSHI